MAADSKQAKSIKRIICIHLSGEYPDFCARLVMPDYGMPLIGTILDEAGYDVTIFVEHVHPPVWDIVEEADLVCMSTLSAGAAKSYEFADRVRSQLNVPVIMGGTHATYFPTDCLEHCDYVVLGEGDEIILDLIAAMESGADIKQVGGIAYRQNTLTLRTEPRVGPKTFNTIPDFELIYGYRRLSKLEQILRLRLPLLTVQSSRGCPFHCTYCIVDTMFPAGYRNRDIESVIEDLKDKRRFGKELLFTDNEFAIHPKRTVALLKRMIEEDLDFDIIILTRTNIVKNDELLSLMKLAGITQIYQGYESIQPDTLDAYDKRQSIEQIRKSINKLHDYGYRISGSFVVGADTDTIESIRATVDFVLEEELTIAYFFPIWGHYLEEKSGGMSITPRHRAIFKGWQYCDGNFVTHFPKKMRPSQLQREVIDAHKRVYSLGRIVKCVAKNKFVHAWEKATHRFMWSAIEKGLNQYIPWLESIEAPFYDSDDQLQEDKLIELYQVGSPEWAFDVNVDNPMDFPGTKRRKTLLKEKPENSAQREIIQTDANTTSVKVPDRECI